MKNAESIQSLEILISVNTSLAIQQVSNNQKTSDEKVDDSTDYQTASVEEIEDQTLEIREITNNEDGTSTVDTQSQSDRTDVQVAEHLPEINNTESNTNTNMNANDVEQMTPELMIEMVTEKIQTEIDQNTVPRIDLFTSINNTVVNCSQDVNSPPPTNHVNQIVDVLIVDSDHSETEKFSLENHSPIIMDIDNDDGKSLSECLAQSFVLRIDENDSSSAIVIDDEQPVLGLNEQVSISHKNNQLKRKEQNLVVHIPQKKSKATADEQCFDGSYS